MSWLTWIALGLVSGFIASRFILGTNDKLIISMIMGIIGAVAGGMIFHFFGQVGITGFNLWSILVAVIGAAIVLWVYHRIEGHRSK